ncbi:hypothetical protein CJ030_MR4G006392 [Morella rubra]|uniref:Uncharacterized protein n=1 Tax=Morella rubra TaxID=262757 RepID=A0A6A1VVP1_9ROSI|nr:hypothetical protein CJ030_MR4G006392 [Morella rubra]
MANPGSPNTTLVILSSYLTPIVQHGENIGLSSYSTPSVQGGANILQSSLSVNSRPYPNYIILSNLPVDRTHTPPSRCRVGPVLIPLPDDHCSFVGTSSRRSKHVHAIGKLNMDATNEALQIDVPL